jgi:hypothetical protein
VENLRSRIARIEETGAIAARGAALWDSLTDELLTALAPNEREDLQRALELNLASEDIPRDLELAHADEVVADFVTCLSETERRLLLESACRKMTRKT